MKIVIRHPLTKQYRCADGSWTNEPDQAQQFGGTTDAVKTCLAKELEKYEILMRHPSDPKYDVLILEHPEVGPTGDGAPKPNNSAQPQRDQRN